MLTGKQRSYLKGLAQNLDPVVSIGKSGLSDTIRKAIDENLEANELVKVSIIGESELDPKEVCNQIAEELASFSTGRPGRRRTAGSSCPGAPGHEPQHSSDHRI